ncbi:YjfI family protein [Pseudoalteromonas luteoviolacea]|uniref:DUF2170 domain-containing protein n=1 Tax=Pseudoalteromonas luteoviolacea H33 TaxID=1365251 RepID=A0A167FRY6_9GAMM|nr:DUF2170 family protein [Pseudoalteromonas luteoviolacea]KZN52719.1 hypothetical protein N476_09810 [Pseudoalteromonas luteoviolacea H33]KZN73849.1 hypothetical protein N477_22785 [Pseudoalteromonas luteoviolacea H33-S]MBQ4880247.1 DUF2170 family protein [Pseudoalteromonas luteoviolacea]MBQ4909308.1 DUF2170 family protein [Pseudoalteromonas luteoviolacea]
MELNELSIKLSQYETEGASFESFFINNVGQEVLQIIVDGNDELPIFVTRTEEQILCICYLFTEQEISADKHAELNDTLLRLNVPMPLSAFAKIDDKYAIFGALSTNSTLEQLGHEIVTLSANSIDALEAISDYLSE